MIINVHTHNSAGGWSAICVDYNGHTARCVWKTPVNCCCNYGAARRHEWPEFECCYCPIHGYEYVPSAGDYTCRRHRQQDPG